MAIFGCQNVSKWFLFRNLHEKLGKKMLWKNFFWSYGGLKWGQKWSHTKINHFTKNGPKSSILSIFQREKTQNDRN
jgi:hypothetical protein